MSILVNGNTRVVVQGMTGGQGTQWGRFQCIRPQCIPCA